jgi:catechol 2,3-dioxygenase-like lactoylglutathione lyase family enzyme
MTNTTRHVGIVVKDLAKSTDFWVNVIGFKIHVDSKEVSPYIDKLLGFENPELRTVKFIDKNGFIIELLEFANYPGKDNWEGNLASTGLTHIALTVDNLDLLASKLKQSNFNFVSNTMHSPNGLVKVVFVRGPEGLMLELVEELARK